ncbi:MAG: hypothetical protein IH899_06805, partial [Planctomycetes bacterium]|nr:hypothetical protein [Planctomycetota bacterium]
MTLPDSDGDGKPEYVIYDGGNGSVQTFNKIKELIPQNEDVELLVISHSDGDHLAAIPKICADYNVKTVLRTGFTRSTGAWTNADAAIKNEATNHGCTDISLSVYEYPRGATFRIGDAFIQFVAGWRAAPESFEVGTNRNDAESRNSISIVGKLIY